MDIVKRAYLKVKDEMEGSQGYFQLQGKGTLHLFHEAVLEEIKRLIRVRAYSRRDWPRELGPIPDELRPKRQERVKNA